MRKKEKRQSKKKDRGIVDWAMIMNHFYPDLPQWVNDMKDPRHESYTIYTQADLVMMGILKNTCSISSMRQMDEKFNEDICIETLGRLSGDRHLEEMPHYDTLNDYLEKLPPKYLSGIRSRMIAELIRGKAFYRNRLLGKYWRVVLDGTEVVSFRERHCPNCLCRTVINPSGQKEKRYYHKVLEAKIIFAENMVLSLGTEFIENKDENVSKQDCEVNAAKRLMAKIKQEYPRLPICIHGDSLYATEPMKEICRKNNWMYIFTQKDGFQRLLAENFELYTEEAGLSMVKNIGKEQGKARFVNHVEKDAGKKEISNMFEYRYQDQEGKEKRFRWVTNLEITKRNVGELTESGRWRWKIENEGFNNQKNGLYDIMHLNSRNPNAMKNHYLLTQIADIIMQLYLSWNPLIREIGQSIKNTSSRLLESFRRQTVTDEDVLYIHRYTTVYLE